MKYTGPATFVFTDNELWLIHEALVYSPQHRARGLANQIASHMQARDSSRQAQGKRDGSEWNPRTRNHDA